MKTIIIGALVFLSAPALAQQSGLQDSQRPPALRDLCSDRPGLNTPACTVDADHLQIELGIASWTLDSQPDQREDMIEGSEILLRYGVTPTTEIRLGWTAYGHSRTRDRMSGEIEKTGGTGDVTLGLKQNFRHPDEAKTGLALALLPYVTLPTGRDDIGAGDWGAGLIVPASYKINDIVSLALSPEIDASVNESGSGRHLAFGTAMGLQVNVTDALQLTPEVQMVRDNDPDRHVTMTKAALSLAFQPTKAMQVDVQAVAGLNPATPDVALAFGISRKF
ncbi:MAG: transporter [Sphingobium sp.]